jgi:hypothetical protein
LKVINLSFIVLIIELVVCDLEFGREWCNMTKSFGLETGDIKKKRSENSSPGRLYYIDWIPLIAIFGVFIYHASRPYIMQEWLLQNDTQSIALTLLFLIFLGSFGMPLFFFVSGASSRFALRKRTGSQYAMERVKRLLLPFIVGCIVLSPIQFYLEWLHKGWYDGPFLPFIPLLIKDRIERIAQGVSPALFEAFGSHLWFLGFLFSFSLLALPLFLWLKSGSGRQFLHNLGRLGDIRGGLMAFVIPVVLGRVLLQESFPGYTDWADFTYMFVFFVIGYIFYADDRLVNAIKRDGKIALVVGLGVTGFIVVALALGVGREWIEMPGTAGFYLAWTLASINGWCWTIFALSVGMQYLQVQNKWLLMGQEAILPFYVFHQPVIVIIGFYVVQWTAPIIVEWPVLVLSSLLGTLVIYQFIVKRIGPLRVLFGMKAPVKVTV